MEERIPFCHPCGPLNSINWLPVFRHPPEPPKTKTATRCRFSNGESIGYISKPPQRGGFDLAVTFYVACLSPGVRDIEVETNEDPMPSRDRKCAFNSCAKGAVICRFKARPRRTAPWARPDRRLHTEAHASHPRPSTANGCFHAAPSVSDRVPRLSTGLARGWRTISTRS